MKILALDLSLTATGWAITPDHFGTERAAGTFTGVERLAEYKQWLRRMLLPGFDLAVIEGDAYGRHNKAHQIGELGGIIRLTLHEENVPFIEVPPAVLKKYATGKGTAPKPDLRMELYKRSGLDVADDNTVDALWLLAIGRELAGNPLWDMPKANVDALSKLQQPKGVSGLD